ncbi:Rho termination factor N-terminal domain-containing protein [Streptomyces sp. NPDC015346]|uniref:Rho termination factor N-terminal domain-containing protein n=1 Tax=Streptomyces sp. NPDC015346 TaxID=3364954 RepID=UPI0036FC7CCE
MSSLTKKVLDAYPAEAGLPPTLLAEGVDKLYECAGVCLACADSAAGESDSEKIAHSVKCMRANNDTADLCTVTARVLARQTGYDSPTTKNLVEATRSALIASADACQEFQETDYFALAARACRETEEMLADLLRQMEEGSSADYAKEPPSATTPAGRARTTKGGGGSRAGSKSTKGSASSKASASTKGSASTKASAKTSKSPKRSQDDLRAMRVGELRELAKDQGVRGASGLRKDELLEALLT